MNIRIAILYGGEIRSHNSQMNAEAMYRDFVKKDKHGNARYCEVDKLGNIYEAKTKVNAHGLFSHIDLILDTTYNHPKKNEYKLLAHKLGVKIFYGEELDNYNHRKVLAQMNIDHPNHYIIRRTDKNVSAHIYEVWRTMHMPLIIKSKARYSSSLITYNPNEAGEYIRDIHSRGDDVVIDEYKDEKSYTVFIIKNFRGESLYNTPIIETFKNKQNSNAHVKYTPANYLNDNDKKMIHDIVRKSSVHVDEPLARVDLIKRGEILRVVSTSVKPDYYKGKFMHDVFNDYGITFDEIARSIE